MDNRLEDLAYADARKFFNDYCAIVDERRWSKLPTLFTPDGTVSYENRLFGLRISPRKGSPSKVLPFIQKALSAHSWSQHSVTNLHVEIRRNQGELSSAINNLRVKPGTEEEFLYAEDIVLEASAKLINVQQAFGLSYLALGTYKHELVYKDGKWKCRKFSLEGNGSVFPIVSLEQITFTLFAVAALGYMMK